MQYKNLKKTSRTQRNTSENSKPKSRKKFLLLSFVFGFLILCGFLFGDKAKALFDPVSVASTIAAVDLRETDGRTNVLVLGSDKRRTGTVTSELTDTILVASIGRVDNNVVLISLPRDLWVTANNTTSYQSKINAVYHYDGSDGIRNVVEDFLGIPIHYHVVVDFALFKDVVDVLGGVNVTVDNAFVDYQYPVEGKEGDMCGKTWEDVGDITGLALHRVFPCRYDTVQFEAGDYLMDGVTALRFVRSRKGTNNEGTDFARSKRQQKVIMAIKDKVLSAETLLNPLKLRELYDMYANDVDSDIDFSAAQSFYLLSRRMHFDSVRTVVLDDRSAADEGGLLYAPEDTTLYGNQYVLIPRAGDYSQVRAYVQKYLFEQ